MIKLQPLHNPAVISVRHALGVHRLIYDYLMSGYTKFNMVDQVRENRHATDIVNELLTNDGPTMNKLCLLLDDHELHHVILLKFMELQFRRLCDCDNKFELEPDMQMQVNFLVIRNPAVTSMLTQLILTMMDAP